MFGIRLTYSNILISLRFEIYCYLHKIHLNDGKALNKDDIMFADGFVLGIKSIVNEIKNSKKLPEIQRTKKITHRMDLASRILEVRKVIFDLNSIPEGKDEKLKQLINMLQSLDEKIQRSHSYKTDITFETSWIELV
jgi:hypothetical protein